MTPPDSDAVTYESIVAQIKAERAPCSEVDSRGTHWPLMPGAACVGCGAVIPGGPRPTDSDAPGTIGGTMTDEEARRRSTFDAQLTEAGCEPLAPAHVRCNCYARIQGTRVEHKETCPMWSKPDSDAPKLRKLAATLTERGPMPDSILTGKPDSDEVSRTVILLRGEVVLPLPLAQRILAALVWLNSYAKGDPVVQMFSTEEIRALEAELRAVIGK